MVKMDGEEKEKEKEEEKEEGERTRRPSVSQASHSSQ